MGLTVVWGFCLFYCLTGLAIQVLVFFVKGYGYKYIAGVYVSIGFNLTNGFDWSLVFCVLRVFFRFNNDAPVLIIEFNLITLLITIWIYRLRHRIKDEELSIATEEIGGRDMPA